MTAPISTVQLADLRRREQNTMDRLVSIISRVRVSDNAGGSTFTEVTQVNVPCRRSPNLAGNTETPFGGQLQSGLQWLFSFPVGTVISRDDEIVDGAIPDVEDSGERFAVMGVLGPRSFELARRVIAVEK